MSVVKRWPNILLLLILLLAAGDLRRPSPAAAQANVDVSVDVGFGGYYRRGTWTAVRAELSNSGSNLDGLIRVRTGGTGGLAETTYSTPLDLPQGARKVVFLYVSLESYEQSLQVEVVDVNDRVVARESTTLKLASVGDLLYVVVTESPYGATDLTALVPGTGRAFQANWLVEDLPAQMQALAGLDVLLFHDVDTGTLRAEQTEAITQWVQAGGHLIVAGGDNWQRTTAGLVDVLPVQLSGTLALDTLTALADYVREPGADLDAGLTVSDSVPNPAAQTLVAAGDVPLIVRETSGLGVVDFLAFDPNAEPFRSWSAKGQLWYALVASNGQQPNWAAGVADWAMAREATLTASSTTLPTFFQLCGFLVLYIVMVGPLNYLVLRQVNRRELAWFTIPVFILLFSFLAYRVGFNLRGNTPTVNQLAMIQVPEQGEQAQVTGLLGIQSPRRSNYDIAVARGFTLRTLPDVGTGLSVPAIINESTRYNAENIPIDAGTIASFVAEGVIAAPHLENDVRWEVTADAAPRLVGSITNTTTLVLDDVVLLIKGESRYLGTLQPGETATVDIVLASQDPGPLMLGNAQALYRPSYAGSWGSYMGSPGWCFNYRGVALTMADIMRDASFPCEIGRVSDDEQETRRRYRLLASVLRENDLSGGRGDGVYLAAWSQTPAVEVELINKPQAQENTSLYLFDLPVTVSALTASVEIPPAMTTWTLIDDIQNTRALLEVAPSQFQVGINTQAVFQFMPLPSMRLAEVDALALGYVGQGPVIVELWNWTAKVWQRIAVNPDNDVTLLRTPDRFVGPENAVNVRITTDDATLYNHIDHVTVAYYGPLR